MIASRAVKGVAFVFISVAGPLAIERYVDAEHQGTVNGVWTLWICFGSVIRIDCNAEILAVLSYAPTFLQGQGMNASLSGFASSLPGLLAAASSPITWRLIDRTGRTKPFLMAALAVSGPATFLMLTQSGALLWVDAALMGFTGYGVPVASLTALPQIAGRRELLGVATGMLMLAMCLGEFFGSLVTPMLLGPAMTNWSFCGSVLLTAGLAATAAMAFCRIR